MLFKRVYAKLVFFVGLFVVAFYAFTWKHFLLKLYPSVVPLGHKDVQTESQYETVESYEEMAPQVDAVRGGLPLDVTNQTRRDHVLCFSLRRPNKTNFRIVVIYETEHFAFVSACLRTNNSHPFSDVILGDMPVIFDTFSVQTVKIHGTTFAVPVNASSYRLEYLSSRYLECRRDMAVKLAHQNEVGELRTALLKDCVYLKELLKSVRRLAMMIGGTLLGWYRQCDIMKNPGDMDFALYHSDLDLSLHNLLRQDPRIKSGLTYNTPQEGFQYKLFLTALSIDIFFLFDTDKHDRVFIGEWVSGRDQQQCYYPRSEMCSGVLLGHRFNVPCRVEAMLEADYGKGWPTPVSQWNYGSDAPNTKYIGPWSDALWPAAHGGLKQNNPALVKLFMELEKQRHTQH